MNKKFTIMLLSLMLVATSFGARLTQKQMTFLSEFNVPVTNLTSVEIVDAGTSDTSSIYSDRNGQTSLINPIVSGLDSGLITFWSRDADYKCTATDGTYSRTVDNMTGSDGRFAFPTYLVAMASYKAGDSGTFIWGDGDDWASQCAVAGILTFTPKADNSTVNIGTSGTLLNSSLNVYVGSALGLKLDASVPSLTWDGGAATINHNSNFNVGLCTGTSTGTITIGNDAAGAIIVDTAGTLTVSSDGAAAITTTDGSADITVDATGGSVKIDGGEAAVDAVTITSAGGMDISLVDDFDFALVSGATDENMSFVLSGATASSIIMSSTGTGTDAFDFDTTAGGMDFDIGGTAAATEDFSVTTVTSITMTATENAAQTIHLQENGGTSGTITLYANQGISTTEKAASVQLTSDDGSIELWSGLDAADAINIMVDSSTAAGITLWNDSGTGDESIILSSELGGITVNANAGSVDIEAVGGTGDLGLSAGNDMTITMVGTGVITIGEFLQVTDNDLFSFGTDNDVTLNYDEDGDDNLQIKGPVDFETSYCQFRSNPVCTAITGAAGGAPGGATGDEAAMAIDGTNFEYHVLGAGQTITTPVITANGLNVRLDAITDEGMELGEGITARSKSAFTIGTDAFYLKVTVYITDVNDFDIMAMGFRLAEAYNADLYTYNTYAGINVNNGTINGIDELNNSAAHETDMAEVFTDATAHTLEVRISAAKAVTQYLDGSAVGTPLVFSWTDTDTVVPFFHILADATAAGEVAIQLWECGLQ